jgi:hypothetical protein
MHRFFPWASAASEPLSRFGVECVHNAIESGPLFGLSITRSAGITITTQMSERFITVGSQ